jgi:hypothetical protein
LVAVAAIQDFVAAFLEREGKGLPVWRWYPEHDSHDLAAPFQAFSLSESQQETLVTDLNARFPEVAAFKWASGFLNIRFHPQVWADFVVEWSSNLPDFIHFLQIPPDLNAETRLWPYRWLVSLHEAAVLAALPGWEGGLGSGYRPNAEELVLLKQLLALPGILQQKGERNRKRTDILQGLTTTIQQLWKNPILTPTDTEGSAFRQGLLRMVLAVATAVGDPLSQSPKDAIGIMQ